MKLCYLTHDKLNPKKLVCHHMACDNVNSRIKNIINAMIVEMI